MRITHIDALRGLTAILVVFFHLLYCSGIVNIGEQHILYVFLKVEVFYVITGFVLPYGLYRYQYKISFFPGFVAKRLLRLEPAYLATVLVCVLLAALAGRPLPSAKQLFLHIGYLNNLFGESWVAPIFWTLAIEFQFYIFLGLTYKAFTCRNNALFVGFTAVLLGAAVSATYFCPSLIFLPRYFGFFLTGVFIFRLRVLNMPVWLYCFLTAATLSLMIYVNAWAYSFTALATAMAILFLKIEDKGLIGRSLHWLGRVSYSLYLIHWPVGVTAVFVLRHVPWLASRPSLRIVLGAALSLVSAWLFYKLVEKPSIDFSRRIKLAASSRRRFHSRIPAEVKPVFQRWRTADVRLGNAGPVSRALEAEQSN